MKGVIVVLIFMVLSQMVLAKVREIYLKKNTVVDGILSAIKENDDYIQAEIEFKDRVHLEFPIDTDEGRILKEAEDLTGRRVLIARIEGGEKALYIAEKKEKEGQ